MTDPRAARQAAEYLDPFTEEKLTGWLLPYVEARNSEANFKSIKENLGKAIKDWLEEHPGEPLVDGEHNLTAFLQERDAPGRDADLNALYDGNQALFIQLLRNGCLKVDEAAIKRAGALVGGVERYLAPKGKTVALLVREVK